MHLPGNGIHKMLDCNSLSDHGTGQGARSLEFFFPFLVSQNDNIHGYVEVSEFATCRDRPLVTRDRRTGNDSKKIDIAIRSGISPGLRSEEPDSLGVNCRAQSIGHEAGSFMSVPDRGRLAQLGRIESRKTRRRGGSIKPYWGPSRITTFPGLRGEAEEKAETLKAEMDWKRAVGEILNFGCWILNFEF